MAGYFRAITCVTEKLMRVRNRERKETHGEVENRAAIQLSSDFYSQSPSSLLPFLVLLYMALFLFNCVYFAHKRLSMWLLLFEDVIFVEDVII